MSERLDRLKASPHTASDADVRWVVQRAIRLEAVLFDIASNTSMSVPLGMTEGAFYAGQLRDVTGRAARAIAIRTKDGCEAEDNA